MLAILALFDITGFGAVLINVCSSSLLASVYETTGWFGGMKTGFKAEGMLESPGRPDSLRETGLVEMEGDPSRV